MSACLVSSSLFVCLSTTRLPVSLVSLYDTSSLLIGYHICSGSSAGGNGEARRPEVEKGKDDERGDDSSYEYVRRTNACRNKTEAKRKPKEARETRERRRIMLMLTRNNEDTCTYDTSSNLAPPVEILCKIKVSSAHLPFYLRSCPLCLPPHHPPSYCCSLRPRKEIVQHCYCTTGTRYLIVF